MLQGYVRGIRHTLVVGKVLVSGSDAKNSYVSKHTVINDSR